MKFLIYPYSDKYYLFAQALPIFRKECSSFVAVHLKTRKCKLIPPACEQLTDNFDHALINTDVVLFLKNDCHQDMVDKIERALALSKNVICCNILKEQELEKLIAFAEAQNVNFEYHMDPQHITEVLNKRHDPFYNQECAVLAVTTLTQGLYSDDAILEIYRELVGKGYNVSVVVSSENLSALGFHYLPMQTFWNSLNSTDELVVQLNRYINYIQCRERSEVILVQFPDETMLRFSESLAQGFGVRSFILSQAVATDYCVMLAPQLDIDINGYQGISDCFSMRFGFSVDAILVVQQMVDQLETELQGKMVYRDYDCPADLPQNGEGVRPKLLLLSNTDQTKILKHIADDFEQKLSSE